MIFKEEGKMAVDNPCRDFAKFVVDSKYADLPPAIAHETKRVLMDSIGVTVGALTTDKGKMAVDLGKKFGGNPDATILGIGDKVSLSTAALVNGELMFTLDYHNIMSNAHDGTYILPTILAFAESTAASGKDLILSTALGCEISSRLAIAVLQHSTGGGQLGAGGMEPRMPDPAGPPRVGNAYSNFGAAAGAGKLMNFDLDTMNHALGLAGHLCMILTKQRWGASERRYHSKYGIPGWQNTGAVMAVLLAEMGYTGDTNVLDAKNGFAHACGYREYHPEALLDEMGKKWWFVFRLHYKPYPCCAVYHAELDCFIDCLEKYNLQPDEIENVMGYGRASTDRGLFASKSVETLSSAQFNPRYIFSVAAHRIPVGVDWHDKTTNTNPSILKFMDKVTLQPLPDAAKLAAGDPLASPCKVVITARGGKEFTVERKYKRGTIGTDAGPTDEDLIKKFRHNCERILTQSKIDRAVNMLMELEKQDNLAQLMRELSM